MGKSEEKSRSVVETRSLRGGDVPQTSLINILVCSYSGVFGGSLI